MSLIPAATLGISTISLLVITLTYFRTKRVKPHEFESMIVRRLEGITVQADVGMRVDNVRYLENPDNPIQAILNLIRKYPAGYTALELNFQGPGVTAPPFSDEAFTQLLTDHDLDGEHVVKEKATIGDQTGEFVDLEISTTRPEEVYSFASDLLSVVSGKYEETAKVVAGGRRE